jgi:hypothetical protein
MHVTQTQNQFAWLGLLAHQKPRILSAKSFHTHGDNINRRHPISAPNPEPFSQKDKVTILLHEYHCDHIINNPLSVIPGSSI